MPARSPLPGRRRAASAGALLALLTATGCAHAGVTVRTREASNTDLPRNGVVRYVYPHVTASAPAVVVYPELHK